MDPDTIEPDKSTSSDLAAGTTSEADLKEVRKVYGDEVADDWDYWRKKYEQYVTESEDEDKAMIESLEAESRLQEELSEKARTKLEAALATACEKDPDIAKLKEWAIDYHEGEDTISLGADDLIANPAFVMDTDPMALVVILRHEWLHHKLDHGTRGKVFLDGLDKAENRKAWAWAFNAGADLEVNSELRTDIERAGLLDQAFIPGYGNYVGWPMRLEAEEYARRIMAHPDQKAKMEHLAKTKFRMEYG